MNLLTKITQKYFGKEINRQVKMAVVKELTINGKRLPWQPKSIYRTRADISTWNEAQNLYSSAEEPRTYALQLLLEEIRLDALLTSQIENRKQQVFSAEFSLKKANGDVDEEETQRLKKSSAYRKITDAMLETKNMEYNMVELALGEDKKVLVSLVPRTNYVPKTGLFYSDYTDVKTIKYRELPDYGKWILEFNSSEPPLLNKSVPHVLFKRFAQSCWSELCEIYGIPPRVMKTNTQDPAMLTRAENMMKDMGAAAWFIIDETESFEWAKGVDTNGDVYSNLIRLCNNENSLLISGAIIGQDTVNGNRSKDESAQNVLWELVKSDMNTCEQWWNEIVIPAFVKIGAMPAGLNFEFNPEEDIKQLFEFTRGLLPFKDVENEWIKDKFGVEVKDREPGIISDTGETKADEEVKKAIDKKLSAFFG